MSSFFGFLDTVMYLGFATVAGFFIFMAYASKQSRDNPLRMMMGALASRVALTIGVTILDIPISTIEPLGGVVDIASLGLLAWYWFTGVREMLDALSVPPAPPEDVKSVSVRPYALREQPGD